MPFEVGSAVARLKTDVTGFKQGISEAKTLAGDFGDKMTSVTRGIADFGKQAAVFTGVVAGGFILFSKQSVDAFNESQVAIKQTEAVLISTKHAAGVTAEAIDDLTKSMQDNTPISDEAARSGANMLLTFTNIGKEIFTKTNVAVADMATAMNGGAVPSMEQMRQEAMLVGKALQDPDAGLGALHRVGVNVDELKKKFTASMPIQEKQKLILQELGTEFGGSAARSIETFAGQMESLKNKFNDIQEKIGGLIVQYLTPLADAFDNFLSSGIADQALTNFKGLLDAMMPSLIAFGEWIKEHQDQVILFLQGLAAGISALLVIGTITALITALLNPLTLLVLGVTALYMAWQTNFMGIRDITQQFIDWLNNVFLPAFSVVTDMFKQRWDFITLIVKGAWEVITGVVRAGWDVISTIVTAGLQLLSGNWLGALTTITDGQMKFKKDIQDILNGLVDFLVGWGGTLFNNLVKPFEDAYGKVKELSEKIKGAMDPNQRHSPSLVDRVNKGVQDLNAAWDNLTIAPMVNQTAFQTPQSVSSSASSSSGMGSVVLQISLDGAIIADEASAQRMASKIGDSIIKKLQYNIRF